MTEVQELISYGRMIELFLVEIVGVRDIPHGKATLYDHLIGTSTILKTWDEPNFIVLSGLFHSIYGTQFFKTKAFPSCELGRSIIARLIGDDAEAIAYHFCALKRDSYPWGPEAIRRHLYTVEAANLIDQGFDLPPSLISSGLLSEKALSNITEMYADDGRKR